MNQPGDGIYLEGTCLPAAQWLDGLKVSREDLDSLVAEGVLRKQPGTGAAPLLRLDFVGLISTTSRACLSLPKVYAGHTWDENDLRRTIGCLQRYHLKIRRGPSSATAGAADFFAEAGTILDLFLALLSRTEESGFHTIEAETFSPDIADVDWRQTLQHSLPAHYGHHVVYVEPRGRRSRQVLSELGEIQALALIDLKHRVGRLSELWLRGYDELADECREIIAESQFRTTDLQRIRSALDIASLDATRDADRDLLSLLTMWATNDFAAAHRPLLYGTTAFHTVWEDMCNEFLGDCGSAVEHSAIASQPAYDLEGDKITVGPQRPDYLRAEGKRVWIADAKWYRFELGDVPQLQDVIKQMVYEMSVSEDFSVERNCLLLPNIGGADWSDVGSVAMYEKDNVDARFPEVRVISIDWIKAADAYRKQLRQNHCLEVFGLV